MGEVLKYIGLKSIFCVCEQQALYTAWELSIGQDGAQKLLPSPGKSAYRTLGAEPISLFR